MHPFLTGDITVGIAPTTKPVVRRKPYVISGK
jgi:hypothetical protein